MWYEEAVFYQIYPLGFCGAPPENDGVTVSRIRKVIDWIPHIKKTGANAVYFSPVFESDRHGYDTRDYRKIDVRLGTNADFADVCAKLHENGFKVVIDGVFNHVGRGFFGFQDVIKCKRSSKYLNWFYINFNENSFYNDGFWYDGWEGHYELVKLNLDNPELVSYLLACVKSWIEQYDIDGLRLDVAYCLNKEFMKKLRQFVKQIKPDFFLVGEMIHGDYNTIVNGDMLDSATNYECYKGLHSSFNSMNMFEIAHSLMRQFGEENWTLYKGKHLLNFVDNHDVSRIASVLKNKRHLLLIYGLMYAMPGIPCIYYGSEWGTEAEKRNDSDLPLRPSFEKPIENNLTKYIERFSKIHSRTKALCYGDFKSLELTNHQFVFSRKCDDQEIVVAINAGENPFYVDKGLHGRGKMTDLITGQKYDCNNGMELKPYSVLYLM